MKSAGYQAYLVGGGVRDLLLGREPKDFDVATDARPEEVRNTFRNCRLIGRRFRLAHIHFGRDFVEVATFRAGHETREPGEREIDNGMILRDNIYGTIEEDALRRDFSINALYYNIDDFSVIDYTNGMQDLKAGRLRLLGDPETRYREDPVRMLRAVRFAARLGFLIDKPCEQALFEMGHLLDAVPAARLFEEVLKLFMGGMALNSFEKLRHYDLFGRLFPQTEEALTVEEHDFPVTFVNHGLRNTDTRVREGKPVTPAFLFAFLLWEPVRRLADELIASGEAPYQAMQQAGAEIIPLQNRQIVLPRRFSGPMQEIWNMQYRFLQREGKRPHRLMAHARFRAAYDFLLLRAQSGEIESELADWWTRIQEVDIEERNRMTGSQKGSGRRRRRGRKRKPA